jgi:hypothetical protein
MNLKYTVKKTAAKISHKTINGRLVPNKLISKKIKRETKSVRGCTAEFTIASKPSGCAQALKESIDIIKRVNRFIRARGHITKYLPSCNSTSFRKG